MRGSTSREVSRLLTFAPRTDGSSSTGRASEKPSKLRSDAVEMTVKGVPEISLTTPDSIQPPKAWPRKSRRLSKNGTR